MSGSIFRRGGQKAEAHGAPAEQEISTDVLQAKLSDLQAAWSAPLIAYVQVLMCARASALLGVLHFLPFYTFLPPSCRASQSLAVWHSSSQAAEVTIERGHVLQRMGECSNSASNFALVCS